VAAPFLLIGGLFEAVDAALMAHAGFMNLPSRDVLGRKTITVESRADRPQGRPAGDARPNALDALLLRSMAWRPCARGLRPRTRIDGVITDGGKIANKKADYSYSRAAFIIRSTQVGYIEELDRRLRACAEGAAQATGTSLSWSSAWGRYLPMKRNSALEAAYAANLRFVGEEIGCFPPQAPIGSTDFGNVSQALPGIHAYFEAVPPGVEHHTLAYAEATRSEMALKGMITAAKALAHTGLDLTQDPGLLEQIRAGFRKASAAAG